MSEERVLIFEIGELLNRTGLAISKFESNKSLSTIELIDHFMTVTESVPKHVEEKLPKEITQLYNELFKKYYNDEKESIPAIQKTRRGRKTEYVSMSDFEKLVFKIKNDTKETVNNTIHRMLVKGTTIPDIFTRVKPLVERKGGHYYAKTIGEVRAHIKVLAKKGWVFEYEEQTEAIKLVGYNRVPERRGRPKKERL